MRRRFRRGDRAHPFLHSPGGAEEEQEREREQEQEQEQEEEEDRQVEFLRVSL